MDIKTTYPNDEKLPFIESRGLLPREDHDCRRDNVGDSLKQPSSQFLESLLPRVRDLVKLILFFALTVIGMTLISKSASHLRKPWCNKPDSNAKDMGTSSGNTEMCPSAVYRTNLSMDFTNTKKFSFTQLSQNLPGLGPNMLPTIGNIEVQAAKKASGSYVHVDLQIRGSDSRLTNSEALGFEKTDSSLVVKTPKQIPDSIVSGAVRPCLFVSAVISISPGSKLENLNIDSESLAVVFHPGLDYAQSRVVETRSHFESSSTYSRETIINVESASITGSYPLYDLLSIHSNSGSINVDINPKNASIENIKPAVLRLTSNSGSVRSITPTTNVPNRDYQTTVSTSSGSIDATILHGRRTSLRSINGQVTAQVYPFGHNDSRTDIETHCTSGGMDITVHSSLSHPNSPLKDLYGYYRGGSGSMNLFYPASWEGAVEGITLSGSLDLDWQGLKVVKDSKDGGKRKIEAVRGEGNGTLFFYESSGSITLKGGSGAHDA